MNSNQWQKVKEIFDSALKQAPDKRVQFLAQACNGDDELRLEVESLLSSFNNAESFLDKPAVGEIAETILAQNVKLAVGQHLNHYEIISQIGAGGMGEVYLAQDTQLRRKVALKLLPHAFTNDKTRARRFKQEARAASALNHPHIIVIHEVGETENKILFIATEYIEGETLRERLDEKGFSLAETLDIAVQLAGALAAAHEAKIVHRDIKPENIMLRPDGYIKVLDFGLAKLIENQFQIDSQSSGLSHLETAPGMIMGTVRYMSPEQARGREVDERSDIWSFGCVIYEMISGRPPFDGESSTDILAAILDKEPQSLKRFMPNAPDELQRIIGKTLRKNKDERYQTIKDVLVDLKDLRNELQIHASLQNSESNKTLIQQTPFVERETTPNRNAESDKIEAKTTASNLELVGKKKRKFWSIAASISVLTILIAAGAWFFLARQPSFAVINVKGVTQVTDWAGLDDFPSLSPDGNMVAYCSDHNGNFEIYVKALTPGSREIQLTNDSKQNFQPAWSPDGQRIAYHSQKDGGIWIIPSSGGDPKQLTEFGTHPGWSPDGKQIVFQSYPLTDLGAGARILPPSTLWLVSPEGGEPQQITQVGIPAGGHGAPVFSPDGKHIAFEVDDYNFNSIWTMPAGGGEAKLILKLGSEPVYAPDGKSILCVTIGDKIPGIKQIPINPDTGERIADEISIGGSSSLPPLIRRLAFSADGKKLVYNPLNRTESLASVPIRSESAEAAGTPQILVQKVSHRINLSAFSPDGKRLAFSSCLQGGTGCDIWLANPDGSNQTQLTMDKANELMPSWFPNMEEIAFSSDITGNRTFWAINLNTKRERLLLDLKDDLEYIRLSPDGKQAVFNFRRNGGVINVWTAALAGGEPKQLTFDKELMGFPAWSPDGKYIAFQLKRGDDTQVMIMPSEGGAPEQLTFDKGLSWIYGFSPDGDKIVFAGFRNGYWNVWWVSRSTKKQHQVTDYKKLNAFVRYPLWSPLGNQIVYEYSETTGNILVADLK
jgi:Tol biopolymer transport system component/tRNA A-37 threonylcarbamoyl transferase component Bud32